MAGILDLFIPKERKFFDYLKKQIVLLDASSNILYGLTQTKNLSAKNLQRDVTKVRAHSENVERISHEITNFLHKTFITPIDREDIKSLSIHVSSIVDSIEKVTTNLFYFKPKKIDKAFLRQVTIIHESVGLLKFIFEEPLSMKRNVETLNEIKDLETEADRIYRQAIGELFMNGKNAIEIIKQKELYENAENTIDDIGKTSDLLEIVIINNS